VKELQNCTNETDCTPSSFISYIYGVINPTTFISPESEQVLCNENTDFESNRKIMNSRPTSRRKRSPTLNNKTKKSIKSHSIISKYRKRH